MLHVALLYKIISSYKTFYKTLAEKPINKRNKHEKHLFSTARKSNCEGREQNRKLFVLVSTSSKKARARDIPKNNFTNSGLGDNFYDAERIYC